MTNSPKTNIEASNIQAYRAASMMPALTHWRDRSQPWSPEQSDVLAWLIAQPEVANFLLSKLTKAGVITCDPTTKLWHGRPL